MPQAVPGNALSPRLLELEPKAMLTLALEQAQIAKDPLRNGKYDPAASPTPRYSTGSALVLPWQAAARRARGRELGL